jgi:acyl-CoA thioester hydrolase
MRKALDLQLRFSDIDSMGHVNNAVYLNYFETARMHFFAALLGMEWDWMKNGIILLRNEVDYLKPLLLREQAEAYIGVVHIGQKSFSLNYSIRVNDVEYCKGVSVLVAYDYHAQQSSEIHPQMRAQLQKVKEEQDL